MAGSGGAGTSSAGAGGASAGQAPVGGSGGTPSGGAGGSSSGSSGASQGGDGGTIGITETNCTLESLHLKVSGGTTFDRSMKPQDACGGNLGDNQELGLTFFVKPPELENTLLISAMGHGIPPGKTGAFTPDFFSFATTGAIWSIDLPDAEHPMACSANLTKFEQVPPTSWRVAGSLSCPAALAGIGALGGKAPLTIVDFQFGMVFDAAK
jgi:hypothetical protein